MDVLVDDVVSIVFEVARELLPEPQAAIANGMDIMAKVNSILRANTGQYAQKKNLP